MKKVIVALLFLLATVASARAVNYVDGWGIFTDPLPDRSTWAAYYRSHARVELGPQQRLANGIAWRLHTDMSTALAFPRLTWMPNARSLRVANALLETAHGGALLDAHANERRLQEVNALRRKYGWAELSFGPAIVQTDIALTYASDRLVSVIDLGLVRSEGSFRTRIIRGLTFDLDRQTTTHVQACPLSDERYGKNWDLTKGNFQFVFGELLSICSESAYSDFIRLLRAHERRAAITAADSTDPHVTSCIDYLTGKERNISDDRQMVLYLTFDGLAVFNVDFWPENDEIICATRRSAINPIIIPYAELAPFMIEGPWRDELLALLPVSKH
ncbi:MAG TPA: hypothetical protein VFB13_02130 [Reyranella sp.]|nr:hypothetical protein [Reyranella sp.]